MSMAMAGPISCMRLAPHVVSRTPAGARVEGRFGPVVRLQSLDPRLWTSMATAEWTSSFPNGKAKLYKNDGKGHFTDVIDKCGDLAEPIPGAIRPRGATSTTMVIRCDHRLPAWPNRYLQNNGDGTFSDKSAEIGLTSRVFKSGESPSRI